MSAEVFFRKYRPRKLAEVVGQTSAVTYLRGMLKTKKVPHVLLFTGESGVGKTTLARIVAKSLGCHSSSDLQEINAAVDTGINTIRAIDRQKDSYPMVSKSRVWILDEAQRFTKDAQSALLKILEEPQPWVYFAICTTDPQNLLPTVRNRCTTVKLDAIEDKDLEALIDRVCEGRGSVFRGRFERSSSTTPKDRRGSYWFCFIKSPRSLATRSNWLRLRGGISRRRALRSVGTYSPVRSPRGRPWRRI